MKKTETISVKKCYIPPPTDPLESKRVRYFRTMAHEQTLNLVKGLTIVGPNSSGKNNLLQAIQLLFTVYDNAQAMRLWPFCFKTKNRLPLVPSLVRRGELRGGGGGGGSGAPC